MGDRNLDMTASNIRMRLFFSFLAFLRLCAKYMPRRTFPQVDGAAMLTVQGSGPRAKRGAALMKSATTAAPDPKRPKVGVRAKMHTDSIFYREAFQASDDPRYRMSPQGWVTLGNQMRVAGGLPRLKLDALQVLPAHELVVDFNSVLKIPVDSTDALSTLTAVVLRSGHWKKDGNTPSLIHTNEPVVDIVHAFQVVHYGQGEGRKEGLLMWISDTAPEDPSSNFRHLVVCPLPLYSMAHGNEKVFRKELQFDHVMMQNVRTIGYEAQAKFDADLDEFLLGIPTFQRLCMTIGDTGQHGVISEVHPVQQQLHCYLSRSIDFSDRVAAVTLAAHAESDSRVAACASKSLPGEHQKLLKNRQAAKIAGDRAAVSAC